MTRETKIGLLVGLAFIIIVGILLGDSVRHATDVQPAPLPQVGTNVRSAVATPGTPTAVAPASAAAQGQQANTQQQQNVQPNQMVPTHEEVAHPHGIDVVVVGPGNGTIANGAGQGSGSSSTTLQSTGSGAGARVGEPRSNEITLEPTPPAGHGQQGQGGGAVAANPGGRGANDPLIRAAQAGGAELVPLGGGGGSNGSTGAPNRAGGASARTAAKTYEAQPGDSLSKIATRFYGSNSKALRDAIVAANPSLKDNPNRILVGQTYTIPAVSATADQPTAAQSGAQPAPSNRSGGAAQAGEYWYTVKENDNLWRIAKEQLGDPAAVAVLKELNKDVLKGGETVRVNMKLRLPSKPIASAS
jgi:nucleoid-associated protein YgaU